MATLQCRRAEASLKSAASSVAVAARVYELTLARAYLDKAREETSEANYGVAIELAGASQRASTRARAPQYGRVTKGRD
jgi:hypothetical protein